MKMALKVTRSRPMRILTQDTAASEPRSEWKSALVKLLLQPRFEGEAEFARPCCGKAKIWEKIAKTMKDLYGYNFSGPDCSKKFSNLRTTYLTIRKRLRPTGASGDGKPGELDENDENDDEAGIMLDTKESDQGTKWEFHQIFRENFGSKASVEPGAHLLGFSKLKRVKLFF
ncbi:unnamed protein product [Bemisia tabaci]|uniref:Myb/SANT-like DNA-binding domain-containing protein n=1 Tax=Bemisia tabaci TaxID=7038 RepID=A0A9P0ADD5_BEMTA|nr:unnamed protein product [Bemisia tabaci]